MSSINDNRWQIYVEIPETNAELSVPNLHREIVAEPHDPVTATASAGVESRPACQSGENTGARYDDDAFFTCDFIFSPNYSIHN